MEEMGLCGVSYFNCSLIIDPRYAGNDARKGWEGPHPASGEI